MSQKHKIVGFHAVKGRLQKNPDTVHEIWVQKGREDQRVCQLVGMAQALGIGIKWVEKAMINEMADGLVHQGVLAWGESQPKLTDLTDLLNQFEKYPAVDHLVLVLDGVTDPHNLGACLRVADAAGVDAVIIPKNNSASVNETVARVACGAAETVPVIQVVNIARVLGELKEHGFWVYGTSDQGSSALYDHQFKGNIVMVMGAEGKGMRELTKKNCDYLMEIPMAGMVSSLNVSVATGVCLFEVVRQRRLVSSNISKQ